MNEQTITFSADEQTLTKTGGVDDYASNIVSYIKAVFSLGTNWSGFDSVRAVWESSTATISTVLDANYSCIVPSEVLAHKSKLNVNLVGSISSGGVLTDRLTTYPILALTVTADARVVSTETTGITASQFEQFVENVQDSAQAITTYSHDSEAWAKGTRGGVAVDSSDETYHNNSKYWAEQAQTIVDSITVTDPDDDGNLIISF